MCCLVPAYSEVLPNRCRHCRRKFTRLHPLENAAVIRGHGYRIRIPHGHRHGPVGGIAIIHKNLSIQQQAEEVIKVKRSESGMIVNPITLNPNNTMHEAVQLVKEKGISGLPIVDDEGKLVGILTNRDIRFTNDFAAKSKTL